jgi:hypothetical protein
MQMIYFGVPAWIIAAALLILDGLKERSRAYLAAYCCLAFSVTVHM